MDKNIEKFIVKNGKDILYYCYKNEIGFPRNCGVVSMVLAFILYLNKEITEKYDIFYVRGHFKNNYNEDECFCLDYEDITRNNFKSMNNCINCTCDFINIHSWIELKDKVNMDTLYVIDFTSCQFNENICDIEDKILSTNFNAETLFKYVEPYSKFIITKINKEYENYIPDIKSLTGKNIYDISIEKYEKDIDTDFTNVLKNMKLEHLLKK